MEVVDQGEFQIKFKTAPNASLDETRNRIDAVLGQLKQVPEVRLTYATIGAGDWDTVRDAGVYVKLSERKDRRRGQFDIQRDVRERLLRIPGIIPSVEEAGRMDTRKQLLISIRGEEINQLKAYAAGLKQDIYKIPGIVDLEVTLEQDIPEYRITVDRQRALNSGVMSANIVRTIGALVGGQAVTTYEDEDGDAVDVRVRLPLALRQDPAQVEKLRLAVQRPLSPAALIPLADLVTYQMSTSPSEISRQDLSREVVISANLDKLPLGTAVERVSSGLPAPVRAGLPGGVFRRGRGDGGTNRLHGRSAAAGGDLRLPDPGGPVRVVHRPARRSCSRCRCRSSAWPACCYLTGDTVNIMSLIGLIMLMGLVTKNAILLVDYAKVLRARGMAAPGGAHHRRPDAAAAHHDDHPGHDLRHAAAGPGPGRRAARCGRPWPARSSAA